MKICYLADATSVHTKKWCNFFKKMGHDVFVVSLLPGDIPGIRVFHLGIKSSNNRTDFAKLSYLKTIIKLRRILNECKPDILHAHYATSYGLLGAMSSFHPFILSVWGADVYDFPKKSLIHEMLIKFVIRKSDVLMSTSRAMAVEVSKYTEKNIIITPFGVNVDLFKSIDCVKDSAFTVGSVKAFLPKYGIEYLVKGFCLFMKRIAPQKARLLLAGKGEQEDELKKLVVDLKIENEVRFLGYLAECDVVKTFNMFDVAVFPSILDSESFGVAAVEAQACGIPVIATNVGGLPEATCPGITSMLVEKMNELQICEALCELYRNKGLRQAMSTAARKYVMDNYNIEDNFRSVGSIYASLL